MRRSPVAAQPVCAWFFAVSALPVLLFPIAVAAQVPRCVDLASQIRADPRVLAATSVITPAAGNTPAYCQVNLTQYHAINIRVGLPLSALDGGTGGVQGAWNGKVQNLGGGGFAGSVGAVTGPVSTRYVGSSTDTGHNTAWCNATNPDTGQRNAQANCGAGGAGFVLDPNNGLIDWQVTDFITDSLYAQVAWSLSIAQMYYGTAAQRNYWNGCSTGGRQGFEMAQKHPELFDGLLVGSPAMNWNRFQTAELWPPVAATLLAGSAGVSAAKSNAANAAAIAACDANDGVTDGLINEPRRCTFDAHSLVCTGSGSDPATCLTPGEADAMNAIWSGPKNREGDRLWGGLTFGTSFGTLLPGGNQASGLPLPYEQYWVHQDPVWDWHTLTFDNFADELRLSDEKFQATASTDSTNLDGVRGRGGKILHYHGISDPLIVPFNSYNYISRVFQRYGVPDTQSFMRSFFYPGNGHCGGGTGPQINATNLFNSLVDWVENGAAPDYVVASQNLGAGAVRTRKICKYPDEAVYAGAGSTDDQANFVCVTHAAEPADLAASSDLGPIMKCKDLTLTAGSTCSASGSVDNGSANRYGEQVALVQSPSGPYGLGRNAVALTGTDSRDASASCNALVNVIDKTLPTIVCPAPLTVECTANNAASVVPPAASAADNCAIRSITGPSSGAYPLGLTSVSYSAADTSGNASSCTTSIRVVDTTPPVISGARALPASLWPPNKAMVGVSVGLNAADTCSGNVTGSCRIVGIDGDDGATAADWRITGALSAELRAERSGKGNGRTYTLRLQCTDPSGNSAQQTVTVAVPHDDGG